MYFESQDSSDRSVIIRTSVVGVAILLCMFILSFKSVIPAIEKDLLIRVSEQLLEQKIDNIFVSVDGRDIYLEGMPDQKSSQEAVTAARKVWGVRRVYSEFDIRESTQ